MTRRSGHEAQVIGREIRFMETLIDYFSRVAEIPWWEVAVELICIGLVVYWAVDFLEGTRGERLFRGVVFILIAGVLILNLVSERFHLERLEYLYKGFLIGVLINFTLLSKHYHISNPAELEPKSCSNMIGFE